MHRIGSHHSYSADAEHIGYPTSDPSCEFYSTQPQCRTPDPVYLYNRNEDESALSQRFRGAMGIFYENTVAKCLAMAGGTSAHEAAVSKCLAKVMGNFPDNHGSSVEVPSFTECEAVNLDDHSFTECDSVNVDEHNFTECEHLSVEYHRSFDTDSRIKEETELPYILSAINQDTCQDVWLDMSNSNCSSALDDLAEDGSCSFVDQDEHCEHEMEDSGNPATQVWPSDTCQVITHVWPWMSFMQYNSQHITSISDVNDRHDIGSTHSSPDVVQMPENVSLRKNKEAECRLNDTPSSQSIIIQENDCRLETIYPSMLTEEYETQPHPLKEKDSYEQYVIADESLDKNNSLTKVYEMCPLSPSGKGNNDQLVLKDVLVYKNQLNKTEVQDSSRLRNGISQVEVELSMKMKQCEHCQHVLRGKQCEQCNLEDLLLSSDESQARNQEMECQMQINNAIRTSYIIDAQQSYVIKKDNLLQHYIICNNDDTPPMHDTTHSMFTHEKACPGHGDHDAQENRATESAKLVISGSRSSNMQENASSVDIQMCTPTTKDTCASDKRKCKCLGNHQIKEVRADYSEDATTGSNVQDSPCLEDVQFSNKHDYVLEHTFTLTTEHSDTPTVTSRYQVIDKCKGHENCLTEEVKSIESAMQVTSQCPAGNIQFSKIKDAMCANDNSKQELGTLYLSDYREKLYYGESIKSHNETCNTFLGKRKTRISYSDKPNSSKKNQENNYCGNGKESLHSSEHGSVNKFPKTLMDVVMQFSGTLATSAPDDPDLLSITMCNGVNLSLPYRDCSGRLAAKSQM